MVFKEWGKVHNEKRGKVKVLLTDKNDKVYGYLQVVDAEGKPTGENDVWFHSTGGHLVGEGYAAGNVMWLRQHYGIPLTPAKDEIIIFEQKPGLKGRLKAFPWTTEEMFKQVRLMGSLIRYKLVDSNDGLIWEGRFSPQENVLLADPSSGDLPDKLGPNMGFIYYQYENPLDYTMWDLRHNPRPGYWNHVSSSEKILEQLRSAIVLT